MSRGQLTQTGRQALIEKLEWAESCLSAILRGEKPLIDSSRAEESWLSDQLTRMYAGHYLSTPASSFMASPGDTADTLALKGDTRIHPVSARFVLNQKSRLEKELYGAGIHNFHVMGADDLPSSDADQYVAVPAGVSALYQTVVQLQRNVSSGAKKLVVIQNNEDSWAPFLKFIGAGSKAVRKELHCAITDSREETKNAILFKGVDIQKQIHPSGEQKFPQGMEMQFGSTQPKKADETEQVILHEKVKARLCDAVVPLHWFLSADEVSKTFEGNALEKVESMMDRIYNQIGYDQICKRLRDRGFDPDRTVFMANDTGLGFSVDFTDEPEFAAAKAEAVPGKPWPDVELGPIVDAMGGVTRFMDAVRKCCERKGLTEPVRYRDTQLYMFFRLAPQREDVKIQSYFGTATGTITFEPRPGDKGSLYMEHFCVPEGQPEGTQGETLAELGPRFLLTDSPQARCLRALMQDQAIPQSVKPMFGRVAEARNRRSRLRLLTQDNFMPDVEGGSGGPGFSRLVSETGWKLSRKKYDGFDDMAVASDAILLGVHSKAVLSDFAPHHVRLSQLFCQAGSRKQILDDSMYGKSLLIVNPDLRFFSENGASHQNWADPAMGRKFIDYMKALDPAEHPWGQQLLLYRYFHENSLIKQQSKYIMKLTDHQLLPTQLRQTREQRVRHAVTEYSLEEYGPDREDMPSITLLGSASTRNPLFTNSAYFVGYESARAGIHLRTGGGRYGIMGAASQGYMDYQDTHPQQADRTHLSAIQMPRTVQFEGLALNIDTLHGNGNRHVAIAPGMDPRMRNLFRSDVIIADAGGLGTLEEIYFFLFLKQQDDPLVRNKKLIIINHAHLGDEAIRLYEPLLAVLPERDKKDILVVPDAESAMDMAEQLIYERYHPKKDPRILHASGLSLSPA